MDVSDCPIKVLLYTDPLCSRAVHRDLQFRQVTPRRI